MNALAMALLCATIIGQVTATAPQDMDADKGSQTRTSDGEHEISKPAGTEMDRDQRLDSLKRAAASYDIRVGPNQTVKTVLREEPILHWNNQVRFTLDGATFIWTLKGRPHAVASIYSSATRKEFVTLDHEFLSLSPDRLIANRNGERVWFPSEAGLTMKPFPDAPTPAKTRTLRLIQMRKLASRLTAISAPNHVGKKQHRQLRLISQPLHRYGSEDEELIDGALFVFVHGTDPDVILLLEAHGSGGEAEWRYGLGRMCCIPLEVRLGDQAIWSVEQVHYHFDRKPTQTYLTFGPIEAEGAAAIGPGQ